MSDEPQGSYLKIESKSFNIELEGEPDFILSSYNSFRSTILKRLIELIQSGDVEPSGDGGGDNPWGRRDTQLSDGPAVEHVERRSSPANAAASMPSAEAGPRPGRDESYIWVYVTHDIYNKVYVIDTETFTSSSIHRFLDGRRMRKVYLDQAHQEFLRPLLGTGKTLWSELTAKGREKIGATGEDS